MLRMLLTTVAGLAIATAALAQETAPATPETPADANAPQSPAAAADPAGNPDPAQSGTQARKRPSGTPPSNVERLQGMQSTGTSMKFVTVPQDDRNAAQIRENLKAITLPEGFRIDLYAVVPDARHIAVGPQGVVTFVGTRKEKVWAVTDRNRDRMADEVKEFAPSVEFTIPNGVCFSPDGFLFVAEQNRVLTFPAAEFFYESPDVALGEVTKKGALVPASEESFNHTARVCRVGPDNKLYVALGQPYNVPPPEKGDLYAEQGIGGIIRMNRDGTGREVFASGVRNSVGMQFNPANGDLWFTDNQVDGMGDDKPPGELNRATQARQNFGFPFFGGGSVRTVEYEGKEPQADARLPEVEMDAHAADLGMDFYTGQSFPETYRGGIFSAQHGSWNRTKPVGARIMFIPVGKDGSAGKPQVFAEGWLNGNGEYLGRPVDVAQMRDGSLLVSDDLAGAVYRISYSQ